MKKIIIIFLILFSSVIMLFCNTKKATTSEGESVLLFDDGTWKFENESKNVNTENKNLTEMVKPLNATSQIKSRVGFLEIWFDPNKWSQKKESDSASEYSFKLIDQDAQAMLVAERITMTFEALKKMVLANARKVSSDVQIVEEKKIKINGVEVLILDLEGDISGIQFRFHGTYWTGEKGEIQFVTFTSKNLYNEYKADMNELLSGLVLNLN